MTEAVNVQCLPYMPLQIDRLRRSKTWLRCKRNPEIAFYMVNLWMRAWHEIPAGSIEDDDDVLADAAMCSPEKWEELKDDILQGWERRDGRVWHSTVTEIATESETKLRRNKRRTEAARETLEQKRHSSVTEPSDVADRSSTESVTDTVTETAGNASRRSASVTESVTETVTETVRAPTRSVTDTVTEHEGKGREGNRREEKEANASRARGTRLPADFSLPDEWRQYAASKGLPESRIDHEAEQFRNHWLADGTARAIKRDWAAAWRTWVGNAITNFGRSPPAVSTDWRDDPIYAGVQ